MSLYLFLQFPSQLSTTPTFSTQTCCRFWTLTLTFPQYWPSLCQPCPHHPQVFDPSVFCTPEHASFHTHWPSCILTCRVQLLVACVSSCRTSLFQISLPCPNWKHNDVCERVDICKAIQTWPHTLGSRWIVVFSHLNKNLLRSDSTRFLWKTFWTCYYVAGKLPPITQYFLSHKRVKIFVK